MTLDEALQFADQWAEGHTFYEGSQGWRVVCAVLAAEVRRLRASPEPLTDEQASELLSVCNFYEQDGWQWVKPKIITKRIREILGAGE